VSDDRGPVPAVKPPCMVVLPAAVLVTVAAVTAHWLGLTRRTVLLGLAFGAVVAGLMLPFVALGWWMFLHDALLAALVAALLVLYVVASSLLSAPSPGGGGRRRLAAAGLRGPAPPLCRRRWLDRAPPGLAVATAASSRPVSRP
jgi:hypothetical protein